MLTCKNCGHGWREYSSSVVRFYPRGQEVDHFTRTVVKGKFQTKRETFPKPSFTFASEPNTFDNGTR